MTETLYLIVKPGRWNHPRIARVSKKSPRLTPGFSAALVKLVITLPDNVCIPRVPVAAIDITPEHLTPPPVTVAVEKA